MSDPVGDLATLAARVGDLAKLTDRAARAGERANERADANARRVGELELLLRQFGADVAALAQIAHARADADDARVVRSWISTTDPDEGRRILADLVAWVDQTYLTYPGVTLQSCWLWHPSVVEELLALRGLHADAYMGPNAGWRVACDWHERFRPGVVARVRSTLGGCELGRHVPGGDRHAATGRAPLTSAAGAVAQTWTTEQGTPAPTDEQIKVAERHDKANTRSGSR